MPLVIGRKDDSAGPVLRIFTRRKNYERQDWISFYSGWCWPKLTFGPASYFDNRWHINLSFGYGKFYINLPIYSKWDECDPPEYGFYFHSAALWIRKGKTSKCIDFPWRMEWARTSCLRADGTWEHEKRGDRKDFYKDQWKDILWFGTYPYTYVLRSGTIQERTATLKVEEREWRPKWFKWTRLFAQKRRTIDIEFNDEVGERTGSWKGGTTGCGYEMKDGELPVQTLRRMEKERFFK